MKKFVLAMFALMLMAGVANANVIGVFADMDATTCEIAVIPYAPVDLFILAVLDNVPAITAAEFGADNMPENLGYPNGTVTITWSTGLVIGNIYEGVALAWDAAQVGPIVLLGNVNVLDFGGFAFDNHATCIVGSPSNPDYTVPVIVDEEYVVHEATGWCFVFNCVGDCDCMSIPVEDTDFSSIKALY